MASGHVERLRSGRFRVVVYAGKDPIMGRKVYLKETYETEHEATRARERLLVQVEAEQVPDRTTTVAVLMERWMDVVDHELSTAETTAGYVRRTINPALGDWTLRKLQHRVDLLDRLYKHLGRCNPCVTWYGVARSTAQRAVTGLGTEALIVRLRRVARPTAARKG